MKEIEKELRKSTHEKQVEMGEFEIVTGELESMEQQEMDNQGQVFETESEVAERRVEKRKREEVEEAMEQEVRRRRVDVDMNMDDENELTQMESDEDLKYLKDIQSNKVILNVGGTRFETSRLTLRKDPESLLVRLFTTESSVVPQGNSIFIDRDASHFKLI